MNDRSAQNIINMLCKQSMAFEGARGFTKRVESGVKFKMFFANRLHQEQNFLPVEIIANLASKIQSYKRGFSSYLTPEEQSKFFGMMAVVYAHDTHFSSENMQQLAQYDRVNRTTLQKTAEFCKDYNIQLTPFDTQREIGSEDWLKIFGYAYEQEGYDVEKVENPRKREIGPNKSAREFADSINGKFVIANVGNGFTFAIERDDSRYLVRDENNNIFTDARGNPVRDRTLTIIFEPGAQIAEQMQRKYFRTNITMNKSCILFDRNLQLIEQIGCGQVKSLEKTNPQLYDKVYKIYADRNTGAFYLQKNKVYGGGRIDAKQNLLGNPIYLTQEEVASLVAPNTLNSIWAIKLPTSREENANRLLEIRENYKYVYKWSQQALNQVNTRDRNSDDYPYSIQALRELKDYLDRKEKMRTGDDDAIAHTAFEGYKIYMIAPEFVMGKNIAEGTTQSGAKTLLPRYEAEAVHEFAAVRTSWVVLYMNVAPTRMQISGRTTAKGNLLLPNFVRQTTERFEHVSDAINYLRRFVTLDPKSEAELQYLSAQSRAAEMAQSALLRSKGVEQPVAEKPVAEVKPTVEENKKAVKPRYRLVDGKWVRVDEVAQKEASTHLINKILRRYN